MTKMTYRDKEIEEYFPTITVKGNKALTLGRKMCFRILNAYQVDSKDVNIAKAMGCKYIVISLDGLVENSHYVDIGAVEEILPQPTLYNSEVIVHYVPRSLWHKVIPG